MLGRVAGVISAGTLFAAGAYTLYLQLTDPEGMRSFILGMAGVLLIAGTATLFMSLKPRR